MSKYVIDRIEKAQDVNPDADEAALIGYVGSRNHGDKIEINGRSFDEVCRDAVKICDALNDNIAVKL